MPTFTKRRRAGSPTLKASLRAGKPVEQRFAVVHPRTQALHAHGKTLVDLAAKAGVSVRAAGQWCAEKTESPRIARAYAALVPEARTA